MTEFPGDVRVGCPGRAPVGVSRRCPRCWSERLRPVETVSGTNLLCVACHRCWRFGTGYLVEVNPYACSGCAHRNVCRA